jgi:hypothetical protein
LYLTRKVNKRLGSQVEAKVLEPVFAFDREVIPVGTVAQGEVSRVQSVSKWERAKAILSGDFTPLRRAEVEFTALSLPDGRRLTIRTVGTAGLNSLYTEPTHKEQKTKPATRKPQPQNQNGGILGTAKQTTKQAAKDRINREINARSRGMIDIVRAPNKREKAIDFLWAKLPYHPQYWRRGARFDAPLVRSLDFGSETVRRVDMTDLGTQPGADSLAHVRLITALDSATTKLGEPVEAVITVPVFSPEHKLVLPEGTRLRGTVVMAKRARPFHRGGQLRFSFQKIELPEKTATLRPGMPTGPATSQEATLNAAEGSGPAAIKIDSEGGVQAKDSKTRLLAPAVALMLASRAADNDAGHHKAAGGAGGDANIGGRTLGGGLGFGLAGSAVSQSSRWVGMAFGYYGLAWSVYRNVIARGTDVHFDKNAMMEIRFGARTPPNGAKFVSGVAQSDNRRESEY